MFKITVNLLRSIQSVWYNIPFELVCCVVKNIIERKRREFLVSVLPVKSSVTLGNSV